MRRFINNYWCRVVLWTLLIYLTPGIVRPVCEYLRTAVPLAFVMNASVILLLTALVNLIIRESRVHRPVTYAWLAIILSIYAAGLLIIERPEEKFHFIEYGFPGYLTFKAFYVESKLTKLLSWISALVLTMILGFIDEVIQGWLPNRYYQFQDVLLNFMSAFLGLCLTWIIESETRV